jgi:hypothetical protein
MRAVSGVTNTRRRTGGRAGDPVIHATNHMKLEFGILKLNNW